MVPLYSHDFPIGLRELGFKCFVSHGRIRAILGAQLYLIQGFFIETLNFVFKIGVHFDLGRSAKVRRRSIVAIRGGVKCRLYKARFFQHYRQIGCLVGQIRHIVKEVLILWLRSKVIRRLVRI